MKKRLVMLLFLVTVLALNSILIPTYTFAAPIEDFSYEITSEGINITKYNGDDVGVTIEGKYTINGKVYDVAKIDEYAFEGSDIESITISEGILKIAEGAFYNCDSITSVILPYSVEEIGLYAFDDCNKLTDVTVLNPDAVIGDSAFGYYYSGRKYYIVDGFSISGEENSTAQEYAITNNMNFKVYTRKVGDVNGDQNTDIIDLVRLKKILCGIITTDVSNADVNGDGKTSAEDLVALGRLLFIGEENMEKHTVVFKDKDGNILKESEVFHGFAAKAPEAPEVNGYTFSGWNQPFSCVVSDMVVVAQYQKITDPSIIIDNVSAKPGETATVNVTIVNNPGLYGAIITYTYDTKLTLTEATAGSAFGNLDVSFGQYKSPFTVVCDGMDKPAIEDGTIMSLTFTVPSDAAAGQKFNISGSYLEGDIVDNDFKDVDLDIISGSITVE